MEIETCVRGPAPPPAPSPLPETKFKMFGERAGQVLPPIKPARITCHLAALHIVFFLRLCMCVCKHGICRLKTYRIASPII